MRIKSFEDVAVANKEVSNKVGDLQKRFDNLQRDFEQLQHKYIRTLETARSNTTTNNLVFTWTGGTTTLSWPAGNLQDSAEKTIVVPAGSLTLSASSYYWMIWNKAHARLVATQAITSDLFSNHENHVICQIFTGTSGQTGVAGGGGSTSQRDLSGARYKNF